MNFLGSCVSFFSALLGVAAWVAVWYSIAYFMLGTSEELLLYHKDRSSYPSLKNIPLYTMVLIPLFTSIAIIYFKRVLENMGYEVKIK